jgi:DNA primase
MISEYTIQKVRDTALIEEVIGRFIELKKKGSQYQAISPFNPGEKTASFFVHPGKQFFKCFSSGQGGDVIKFLMATQNMPFNDAIEWLANHYGIEVTYEGNTQSEEKLEELDAIKKVLEGTARHFQKHLHEVIQNETHPVADLLRRRNLTKDDLLEWGIGLAPDEWRFITDKVTPQGLLTAAIKAGVCDRKEDRNFDFYRNRLIIPIHDSRGQVISFGARALGDEKPKYMNGKESPVYLKDRTLFGLHRAARAIGKQGMVYITEGYFDVISLHRAGVENTVATCGTALTSSHAKMLRRYTQSASILMDGDSAGQKAALKAVPVLLQAGFIVKMATLPGGLDPDEWICQLEEQQQPEPITT